MISTALAPVNLLFTFVPQTTHSICKSASLLEKIYHYILPHFKGGSSLFFLGYGTKELLFDARQSYKNDTILDVRINKCRREALEIAKEYALAHGTLFIGAGIGSAFQALHLFAVANLARFVSTVGYLSTSCFLFANVVALEQNIYLYTQAHALGLEKEEIWQIKKSSILGIISNIGYILATAISLLGSQTAIVLFIGCIAASSGCLKILYDFFIFYLNKNYTY